MRQALENQCTILAGDVRQSLKSLPDGCVHTVVTSPPYWSLRSYLPSDHPLKSFELGSEPTPELFIENLVGVFREVRRVLRDDGVCWVNLGDSYASTGKNRTPDQASANSTLNGGLSTQMQSLVQPSKIVAGLKPLDRCLIPHQFAMAMRADGWYLRDDIVWAKPSAMPSSVDGWRFEKCKRAAGRAAGIEQMRERDGCSHSSGPKDAIVWESCPGCPKCTPNNGLVLRKGSWRTTTSHESIFMFAKTDSYYCDRDAVATEAAMTTVERNKYSRVLDDEDEQFAVKHEHEFTGQTANLRSVWIISAEPTSEKHYAAYPTALAERCILASTSAGGVCAECGAPWARVVEKSPAGSWSDHANDDERGQIGQNRNYDRGSYIPRQSSNTFRPTCNHIAATKPATVLDPFGGTGRTSIAAIRNGRRAILCELNPASVEISARVVGSENPLFGGVNIVEHTAA